LNTETPVALNIPGLDRQLRMYVHGPDDQYVSRRIREEGIWEPFETQLLLQLLSPGDVFVDVGANIGYFSVLAAQVVGDAGGVYAFEPDPGNYELLCSNAELNGLESRIEAVAGALSDKDGEGSLFLSDDNFGDHQIFGEAGGRHEISIALYEGSDYLVGRTGRIDLLKVDTQGSEYRVMAGLMPLLERLANVPCILIELTPWSLRQAGSSGRRLIELLAQLALPMWIVDHVEHRVVASDAQALATWCDNVDSCAGDQGFMNILVGDLPPELAARPAAT
jgi:FkbM family methyltransferase